MLWISAVIDCYTLSMCWNDCVNFSGHIDTNGEVYVIEPLDGALNGKHKAYRESDSSLPTGDYCGTTIGHLSLC